MKTILITGANRGIGLEICRQLDETVWQIILCSRDVHKGHKAALGLGKKVVVKQLDVRNEDSVNALYDDLLQDFGKLDVLINNAALGSNAQEHMLASTSKQLIRSAFPGVYRFLKKAQPSLKNSKVFNEDIGASSVSLSRVRFLMETNLYGPWSMIQHFLPLLERSKMSQIINISSGLGALESMSGQYPAYSMTKAALNMLTLMFSEELAPKNIRVNAVCPGWVKTDMGGPDAPRSVGEGAETIVWLANQQQGPSGKFYRDREIIAW
jgi:NAD(P)-dependent dehydrogenase (short-subunit alcohol dehydrogenase family)